jgi:hypothetical protein
MPKSMAQWTGFTVTAIVVLGRDMDVIAAVPLGIAAGLLASVLHAAMRGEFRLPMRLPAIRFVRRSR